ncbi:MAG: amidophosphoribosyltransferase [Gammaproteobacteria bacterium 28-57-27]|nr:MAG: amidophosphoribosyltransferase [Gammaproteobacteria bacterium 28-57-27]
MCGIIGVVGFSPVNQIIYDGLTILQHRGQDAAGMMTSESGRFYQRKDKGLVKDVFHTRHMRQLHGNVGIGHVRYPTAGNDSAAEAQPFYVNAPYGIGLGHNGNLTNTDALRVELHEQDLRHINTTSDSEVLLNVFAHELQRCGKLHPEAADIFDAIERVHRRIKGGYAVVGLIAETGVFAFRDPFGIRPLCYGTRTTELGVEVMIASESVAVDALGFELVRDLAPGEAIFVSESGEVHTRQCADHPTYAPCIFEFVYLARPDSIMDGISVYQARMRMGEKLADKVLREWPDHDIDVIIPIPDTSRTAALEMAVALKLPYREGFIKNRYIGRTFIMPGQAERKKSVRQKLNAIDLEFKGKNVLLVDDSIVRGTTSAEIIRMAREAGANKVYMASAAPPVRYAYVYGIDMPSPDELIAHGRSEAEVGEAIGADRLIYQDLDDLVDAVRQGHPNITQYDCSCFTGEYVTGDVTEEYLAAVAGGRADGVKTEAQERRSRDIVTVGLHNAE